jgi:hypothetical protein
MVIGLVRHGREDDELARSQSRVRLSVTAWLHGAVLLETLELEPDCGPGVPVRGRVAATRERRTVRHLVELAIRHRVHQVLTVGEVGSPTVEDGLVWAGLQVLPIEQWQNHFDEPVSVPIGVGTRSSHHR